MKLVVTILLIYLSQAFATAADWDADFTVFIEESCVACHDADTDTSLDLTSLGFDLENEDVFRTWVKVFDRVERHEMPPESDPPRARRLQFFSTPYAAATKPPLLHGLR